MTAGFFVLAVIARSTCDEAIQTWIWSYWLARFALAFFTAKYAPKKFISATTVATASNTKLGFRIMSSLSHSDDPTQRSKDSHGH